MKIKKAAMIILAVLPLIITAVMIIFFLPEQIPAHYNAAGDITRWGSKYEALIMPAVLVVFMGVFYCWFSRSVKAEAEKIKANAIFIGSVIVGLTFNFLLYDALFRSMHILG